MKLNPDEFNMNTYDSRIENRIKINITFQILSYYMTFRIKIFNSIFHVENKIEIYESSNENVNYVEQKKKKTEFNNNYQIGKKVDDMAPITLVNKKEQEKINLYVRVFSNYEPYEARGYGGHIINGLNTIDYSEIKSDSMIIFFRQINGNMSFNIEIKLIEDEDKNSDEKSDYVRKLLNPYTDKNIGSHIDSDINEERRIRSMLEKDPGCENINIGSSRVVYKITNNSNFSNYISSGDGCIVKLSTTISDRGKNDNKKEFQTWQAVKGTELEKYFCPITNFGPDYKYIIMEEASVKKQYNNSKFEKMADEIDEILDRKCEVPDDVEAIDISDSKMSYNYDINSKNVGIYDGNAVMIDYPFGAKINIIN